MKAKNLYRSALLAAVAGLLLPAGALAATYIVNSTSDAGTGGCDAAECTLREAIAAANGSTDDDILMFDGAVFSGPQTIALTQGQLSIAHSGSLMITGPGADRLTVSGNNASRVFFVNSSATTSISGLTVTAARATVNLPAPIGRNGGGIVAGTGSSVSLTGIRIIGNYADSGGGVLALPGSVVRLADSTVSNNTTLRRGGSLGGGLYNDGGTVNIEDSIFTGNDARNGGGIYNGGGTMRVSNSTISGNTANDGGGVANGASFRTNPPTNGSDLTLNNSTISGNLASINPATDINGFPGTPVTTSRGGGFSNRPANQVTLNNSTISGNAAAFGGGIWNGGSATLTGLTLSDNSASASGGGGIRNSSGVTSMNSTIVANSTAGGDCATAGGAFHVAYSLIEDGLACLTGMNLNNLIGDPNLGPLQNNGGPTQTHALLPGSTAIDAGNASLTSDQRGLARPFDSPLYTNAVGGNGSDIGAFEYQGLTPTDKDQCKQNGYMYFDRPAFMNQGQCIQFVNTGK